MFDNAELRERLRAMIGAIEVPSTPTAAIVRRAAHSESLPRPRNENRIAPVAIAAAVAFALILAATPSVAPSFVETLQARIARVLQWTPPPPAPRSIDAAMVPRIVSLKTAQTLVGFHIVPPSGLPRDVASLKIIATPTAVYWKAMRAWHLGAPSLSFSYRRSDGRQFTLLVDAYDPRTGTPPRYIYDADEIGRDGLPKRDDNFAWRNGGQYTSVVADAGLSAREIKAIRSAMHGVSLRLATTRAALMAGSIVKKYAVP